MLFVRFALMKK